MRVASKRPQAFAPAMAKSSSWRLIINTEIIINTDLRRLESLGGHDIHHEKDADTADAGIVDEIGADGIPKSRPECEFARTDPGLHDRDGEPRETEHGPIQRAPKHPQKGRGYISHWFIAERLAVWFALALLVQCLIVSL